MSKKLIGGRLERCGVVNSPRSVDDPCRRSDLLAHHCAVACRPGRYRPCFRPKPENLRHDSLPLTVLRFDTARNIVENLYFGLYFGGQYGLFPAAIVGVLGNPNVLIVPKIVNVLAACAVLGRDSVSTAPTRIDGAVQDRRRAQAQDRGFEFGGRRTQGLFKTSLDLIL